jgi:hypothetical protein
MPMPDTVPPNESSQRQSTEYRDVSLTERDWRPIFGAAAVALLVAGGLLAVFGGVSPYARPDVLAGLTESVFWLAAALIGACGTIAALMLTTVGLLEHLETRRLTGRFLFHLHLVVTAALATIALAVLALLLTVFPTSGTEGVQPEDWQIEVLYWTLLAVTALMIGGFATVLGSLYVTIGEIFATLPKQWVDEIFSEEAEDRAKNDRTMAET